MYTDDNIRAMLKEPPKEKEVVSALRDLYHWNEMGLPPEKVKNGQCTAFGVAASILAYYDRTTLPAVKLLL